MHRQFRQVGQQARQVLLRIADERAYAHALVHPLLDERLGGGPQVQLWVELAAQALDVQQGLLQQHQLRLDLHVEASRGLEQAQQDLAKGDLVQRALEDRFAHGADGRLEFVDAGVLRHPAGFHVQLGYAAVITVEKGVEVLRQIALVGVQQRADDAEVHRQVGRVVRVGSIDEDVARVHVGVEEVVLEHLGEEDLHPALGQQLQVHIAFAQGGDVGYRNAADALHHDNAAAGVVPDDLRDVQQVAVLEVAVDRGGVRALADQVQLVGDGLFVFVHDLARAQALGLGPVAIGEVREQVHHLEIRADGLEDSRTDHLDHHLAPVLQGGRVHLGDGGRCDRRVLEDRESNLDRALEFGLDYGARLIAGERRDPVLQA